MQSQTRNWFIFFGCFFALLLGHSWLRMKLWPPPERPKPETLQAVDHFGRVFGAISGAGLRDASALATQLATTRETGIEYALAMKVAEAKAAAEAAAKPKPAPKVEARPEPILLGDDDYLIKLKMTALGAGVEELTLTKFHEADKYGLPVKNADGSPKMLDLIPRTASTSFAIYHYSKADGDDKERPLDSLGTRLWTVVERGKGDNDQSISFATDLPEHGVRLVKTFTLRKRELHVGLTVRVERLADAKTNAPFRYQLAGGRGLPLEGIWYSTQYRSTMVGLLSDNGSFERSVNDGRTLSHTNGGERYNRADREIQYAAVAVQYFASAIVTVNDQANRKFIEFVRATIESQPDPKQPFLDDLTIRTITESLNPKPGEPIEHKYLLYHGPVKIGLLKQLSDQVDPEVVQRYEKLHLATLTDYGNVGFVTELIIYFTNLIHWLLSVLRYVFPNNGVCIILVTVIVRGLMFPISRKQTAIMARTQENMGRLQPEIKKVKEKYKGDMLEQQRAMSELYKKHGVNPAAGLGGCLMIFLQMPIFLGLYFAIQESFFFRLSPFLWIRNLAAPDMLIWWGEKIPWISDPASMGGFLYLGPYFNLLPIIAIVLMFIQQQMSMPPAMDEQTRMQQSMMKYMMIFFGFMFYKVPAGLSLYFICSSLWGLAERKLLPKKKPGEGGPGKPAVVNGKPVISGPKGKAKPKADEPPGKLKEWWEKLLKEAAKK